MTTRRAVITGLGAVTPLGMNADETWQGLLENRCGIDRIKSFDPSGFACRLAGEVGSYKIRDHVPKSYRKAVKLMSRDIELSVLASNEAVKDANLVTRAVDPDNVTIAPDRMAINFGAGLISCDLLELAPSVAQSITDGKFDIHKWGSTGMETLTPIWLLKYLPNMLACHVGIIHDIRGPSNSITCGEASGTLAISEAFEVVRRGCAEAALAGGCEAKVNPIVMLRQILLNRSTVTANDNPCGACRPFAADAAGCVFGEAAGVITIEELETAQGRNAEIYAEITGVGSSNSINPVYQHLEKDGRGIQIAIKKAMTEAGISPADIDLIIPHGTAVPCDDAAEAEALESVMGEYTKDIIVWPTKSMLSNTGAGAGALDVLVAAKAVSEGKIGSALNCEKKSDGCNLNISDRLQEKTIRNALCLSYSFGGQVAAVVLSRYDE